MWLVAVARVTVWVARVVWIAGSRRLIVAAIVVAVRVTTIVATVRIATVVVTGGPVVAVVSVITCIVPRVS